MIFLHRNRSGIVFNHTEPKFRPDDIIKQFVISRNVFLKQIQQ
jgi:hypothetical protein